MALRLDGDTLHLEATCGVEEALALLEWLGGAQPHAVDLRACSHMHTALLQVLVACRPRIVAPPEDDFLVRWLMPLLSGALPAAVGIPGSVAEARPVLLESLA